MGIPNQARSSSETNDNNEVNENHQWMEIGENTAGINAFYDVQFDADVKRVMDVGGGRYDHARNYLKRKRNIELLVWDPYNRDTEHNARVRDDVSTKQADAGTSMSVLNVIPELEGRLLHIRALHSSTKLNGKVYFKVWPGDEPLRGTYLPSETPVSYQLNSFSDRFFREIEAVFGIGQVKISQHVPNLIVAVKSSDYLPSIQQLKKILQKSKQKKSFFDSKKEKSMNAFYKRASSISLFFKNKALSYAHHDHWMQEKKSKSPEVQHVHDKRFGLIHF